MNIDQPAENIVLPGVSAKKINLKNGDQVENHRRSLILSKLPPSVRGHVVAVLGEFVGTFMFIFLAFSGTQVANTTTAGSQTSAAASVATAPNTSNLLYVALSFGFSLAVNAWVFFRVTGGLFNPAVTFGMMLIGAVTWVRGALIIAAQIVGAIAASGVVSALFPGPMLVKTTLSVDTSIVRGLFIEMFLTAELVFTIFMLAAEKHKANFIAPIGIGLALFVCELCGVYYTGGSLNPARSFGPAVINGGWHGYHWIYWVGPGLGAMLAVAFYKLIKVLEYETVNPPADEAEKEAKKFVDDDVPAEVAQKAGRQPSYQGAGPAASQGTLHGYSSSTATGNTAVDGHTTLNGAGLTQTYSPPVTSGLGGMNGQNRYAARNDRNV